MEWTGLAFINIVSSQLNQITWLGVEDQVIHANEVVLV